MIDGTGAPAQADRTILINVGKIVAGQADADTVPAGYTAIDVTGRSVLPGIGASLVFSSRQYCLIS